MKFSNWKEYTPDYWHGILETQHLSTIERYFLIKWLDEEELIDVVPARDISSSVDLLDLSPGQKCCASFKGELYDAEVLAVGMVFVSVNFNVEVHISTYIRFICGDAESSGREGKEK